MDDFYKEIKKSVDGIPEVTSSKMDWDSFQSYRKEKNTAPAKPFPWLLASTLGLIALLVGTNIYWATRSSHQAESLTLSTIHDTIYITKVIEDINSDLSNNVAALESQLQKNEESSVMHNTKYKSLYSQFSAQSNLLLSLRTKFDQQESQLSFFGFSEKSRMNVLSTHANVLTPSNDNKGAMERPSLLALLDLHTLPNKELAYNRSKVLHPSSFIWIKNEKPFNLLEVMKPKSFSLNFNAGYQFSIRESDDNSVGAYYDLRATTIFTKNVRGYLGLSLFKGRSELENWTNYANIPMIVIPDDDNLKEVKVAKSSVGLNVGLEYMIYTSTRLRPHLGLGYAQSFTNKDKFSFEIESPLGEYYISPEGGINQAQLRQMIFSLGTDYNLSAGLDLRAAVTYYQGLSSNSSINCTGGVYYHF